MTYKYLGITSHSVVLCKNHKLPKMPLQRIFIEIIRPQAVTGKHLDILRKNTHFSQSIGDALYDRSTPIAVKIVYLRILLLLQYRVLLHVSRLAVNGTVIQRDHFKSLLYVYQLKSSQASVSVTLCLLPLAPSCSCFLNSLSASMLLCHCINFDKHRKHCIFVSK